MIIIKDLLIKKMMILNFSLNNFKESFIVFVDVDDIFQILVSKYIMLIKYL
jgi:hypothetical protein